MQEQEECGVYGLAVATALCNQQDPSVLRWKQDAIWSHVGVLRKRKLDSFPRDGTASSLPKKEITAKATTIQKFYCIFRSRYKPKDTLKRCKQYTGWLHADCLKIPATVLVKGENKVEICMHHTVNGYYCCEY